MQTNGQLIRRRVKRDAGAPDSDSSDYVTTLLPSQYVKSTSNKQTTNAFTTGTGKVDELGSTQLSNLFTTADVSTEVYRISTTKDGFDEVVSPTKSSGEMVNSNVEGNLTVDYSRPTVASLRNSSEENDEGVTLVKDNLLATSATTNEADATLFEAR